MKTEKNQHRLNSDHLFPNDLKEFEMSIDLKRKGALPPPPPQALCDALDTPTIKIKWLAGDGSDRCYYRLFPSNSDSSLVLMQLSGRDAIALEKGGYEWIQMGSILTENQITIPKVIATLPDYAAIIIEDYGNLMLEGAISKEGSFGAQTKKMYQNSIDIVANFLSIEKCKDQVWCQRGFDQERFEWELHFFYDKYLAPIASIEFDEKTKEIYAKEVTALSIHLSQYSNYFVHRDYHSRNIMVSGDDLAVIDFQDARLGPPSYDLVSLIFDSYVNIPNKDRLDLLRYGISKISEVAGEKAAKETKESWKPTILQRQLKAIGSFGFLTLEKNRGDYLKYVGPALKVLKENQVYDKRWPFISGELLDRMIAYLGESSDHNC